MRCCDRGGAAGKLSRHRISTLPTRAIGRGRCRRHRRRRGRVQGSRYTSPKRKRGIRQRVDMPCRDDNSPPRADPLAYFLTWTTYGTWLPGDERGWVRRPGIFEQPSTGLARHARQQQAESAIRLNSQQRQIVEDTIAAHCKFRGWKLWIARAMSNHVHVVVTAAGNAPDAVMDQLKAWCTRRLKEAEVGKAVRKN